MTTELRTRAILRGNSACFRALRRYPNKGCAVARWVSAQWGVFLSRFAGRFFVGIVSSVRITAISPKMPSMFRHLHRPGGQGPGAAVVNRTVISFAARLVLALPCSVGLATAQAAVAELAAAEAAPKPEGTEIEDRPEILVPKKAATEEQKYKQQALSHYAAGLMYEQRGDKEEALRQYQRALRYDPTAAPVLQQVVEVAWSLERHQEAIRYALRAAEVAPSNPELLERLAAFLIQENDVERAVELYEKAIELQPDKAKTAGYIRLKMLVGQLYAQLDDFEKAADALAVVFTALQSPEDYGIRGRTKSTLEGEKGRSYLLMGETFLRVDRTDDASAAFEKGFKISGDDALHAYNQAQVLEKQKKAKEAIEKLAGYFEAESDAAGSSPYELLKRLYAETKQSDAFVAKLEALLKEDPKNVPLRYALAGEYRSAKKFDKAKPLYDDLLRRAATLDAYEGVLEASLATKDFAKIVEVLAEVSAKTGSLDAVEKFVDGLIADPKQLDAFAEAARPASEHAEPEDGKPVAFAAAQVLLKAKKYDLAAEFYELALLHDPKNLAAIFQSWGMGLLGDEQHEPAIKVFTRAVDEKASPEEPVFHTYLALSLEFAGRTDEALEVIRKAITLSDDGLRYESRLPWILYHAKRYRDAAAAYEKLLEKYDADHKSDQDRKLLREARLAMSNVYVMLGEMDSAEKPLEAVLDEFPDDVGAMNDLGYLWADRGKNLELALEMVRKAVASDPENKAYRDSLGWVYYRLKRFPEAIVELELAVGDGAKSSGEKTAEEDDGPDGVILDHLADAYAAVGRTDDARKTWQRAEKAYIKSHENDKLAAVRKKLAK